jgi:hypothetical protein
MQRIKDDARGEAAIRAALNRLVVDVRLQRSDVEYLLNPAHELKDLFWTGSRYARQTRHHGPELRERVPRDQAGHPPLGYGFQPDNGASLMRVRLMQGCDEHTCIDLGTHRGTARVFVLRASWSYEHEHDKVLPLQRDVRLLGVVPLTAPAIHTRPSAPRPRARAERAPPPDRGSRSPPAGARPRRSIAPRPAVDRLS